MQRAFFHTPTNSGPFALRFRLLMSYHDLTLRDIAAGTRCAVSTVGTWKNGRVPSSERVVERLAEIFHVSVEYLLEGRPAGRKGGAEAGAVAGRVLEDLELLMRALEAQMGPVEAGWKDGREAPQPKGKAGKNGAGKGRKDGVMRAEVEAYVRAYLDRAEREPGGLAHAWVQLRREFPLDLYERLV